jgi:hypothetical protein
MTLGNATVTNGTLVLCNWLLTIGRLEYLGPYGTYSYPHVNAQTFSFVFPNGLAYVQSQNNKDNVKLFDFQQLCFIYYRKMYTCMYKYEAHANFLVPRWRFFSFSYSSQRCRYVNNMSFENNNSSYSKLTVNQLKLELIRRNASTKGRKHDLIER